MSSQHFLNIEKRKSRYEEEMYEYEYAAGTCFFTRMRIRVKLSTYNTHPYVHQWTREAINLLLFLLLSDWTEKKQA